MLTIGNEFGFKNTDWACVNEMVQEIKLADPRRLYSGCTARKHLPADDYWVTHDSGAATRGIGPAHADWDFAKAAAASPVPVIAHETGQRPVFPDYERLLPAFTGPLAPLNLERYRRALQASGMEGQAREFVRASALFQLTQYKAEHEGMLRTPGFSGYQLLMLNDFTGQSEALVGVLDPFLRSKGVVSPARRMPRLERSNGHGCPVRQVRLDGRRDVPRPPRGGAASAHATSPRPRWPGRSLRRPARSSHTVKPRYCRHPHRQGLGPR